MASIAGRPGQESASVIGASSAPWDAETLRNLWLSTLEGDQVIVVSNREPCVHERIGGTVTITRPASGLVTAVEPVARACSATWIAHGSGNADRDVVDDADVSQVSPDSNGYRVRRVWLTADERSGHGEQFSNAGLWPLCHMASVCPAFGEHDWNQYRIVNQRFADAVAEEARQPDPIVLVQDYLLALVPAMVRTRLPRATIVTFWHIPWAPPERMRVCPWLSELMDGLLGSDIMGLQTPSHRRHFVDSADQHATRSAAHHRHKIASHRHHTRILDYPISIAWPTEAEAAAFPSVERCRVDAAERWSLPSNGRLIVGVDRFDYAKGLIERLRAVEHLLLAHRAWLGRLRFVQVAAPTRTGLSAYTQYRLQVFAEVRRINARFARMGWVPIVLLDEHHEHEAITALYRAADLCLVTSLQDGMNLGCKEFVAARDDDQGVLVLSRFAGAAHELSAALIVDPHHTEQVADALHRGLSMSSEEQRWRMQSLRATVKHRNVFRWAASVLLDTAALRSAAPRQRNDRVAGGIAASV